jgi:hypothetical protein
VPVSEFWAIKSENDPLTLSQVQLRLSRRKNGFHPRRGRTFLFLAANLPQFFLAGHFRFDDAFFMETGNQAGPNEGESKMEKTAKKGNAPTHNVVIGENRQVGKQIVTYWTKVGSAWVHEDGNIFLRIRKGISVSGQIALFPPKEKAEEETAADEGEAVDEAEAEAHATEQPEAAGE